MVKYLKFNLHSLFMATASVSCVSKTKQNLIVNHTQEQHNLTFATEVCYSCTRHFLLGTFYSYKTVRTCSEPRSVERRLSFAVEVTTASGNWKHPLSLKVIFSARFQWLPCFKNGSHLTPPTSRNPRTAPLKCVSRIYIYIYVCIYNVSHFPLNYD